MLSVRQLGKWWRCAWNPSFLETEVKVSKVIEQCLPEHPRKNVKSQVNGDIVHRCWARLPIRQEALGSGPANTVISPKDSCRASCWKPISDCGPANLIELGFWTLSYSFSGSWVLCCNGYAIRQELEQRVRVLKLM